MSDLYCKQLVGPQIRHLVPRIIKSVKSTKTSLPPWLCHDIHQPSLPSARTTNFSTMGKRRLQSESKATIGLFQVSALPFGPSQIVRLRDIDYSIYNMFRLGVLLVERRKTIAVMRRAFTWTCSITGMGSRISIIVLGSFFLVSFLIQKESWLNILSTLFT